MKLNILENLHLACFNWGWGNSCGCNPCCRGPQGPQGPWGPQGFRGPTGPTGPAGATGQNGAIGPTGANGATGATGIAGPTGADGIAGAGAIIPLASNTAVTITSLAGGLVGLPAFIGFGNSINGINTLTNTIDLLGLLNMSFQVPRNGTITSIHGFFSVAAGISLIGGAANILVSLYESTTPDDDFTLIPGSTFQLTPSLGGVISIGDIAYGSTTVSIPVTAGTRLLYVVSMDLSGLTIATILTGYVSGGIAIS